MSIISRVKKLPKQWKMRQKKIKFKSTRQKRRERSELRLFYTLTKKISKNLHVSKKSYTFIKKNPTCLLNKVYTFIKNLHVYQKHCTRLLLKIFTFIKKNYTCIKKYTRLLNKVSKSLHVY